MISHERGDEEDGGSDWLNDSGDEQQADQKEDDGTTPSMAARDSAKVEQRMYDEGYREGISAGKESMIQPGFDAGYAQQGASVGRALGRLRGTLQALDAILRAGNDEQNRSRLARLTAQASALCMSNLVEQDWEAIEHAKEHGDDVGSIKRETESEKAARESIISDLLREADAICQTVL